MSTWQGILFLSFSYTYNIKFTTRSLRFCFQIAPNFMHSCFYFSCVLIFVAFLRSSLPLILFPFFKNYFFYHSYCNQDVIHSIWNLFIVLKPEKGWRRCEILSFVDVRRNKETIPFGQNLTPLNEYNYRQSSALFFRSVKPDKTLNSMNWVLKQENYKLGYR